MSELLRALGAFTAASGPELGRIAGALGLSRPPTPAEHADLFLFQLYPYAAVYVGPEGMLGGEGRDRVAGFWRALGITPPPEPDHLASLLGLHATLSGGSVGGAGGEAGRGAGHARAALLHEHVASWIFPWLDKAMEVGAAPCREWAGVLREAVLHEVRATPPPLGLPLHLRQAPPLGDPREEDGEGRFLEHLLAPVRSGVVLTRADLARAGRELGLGVRMGERRYVLEAFFGQDPPAILGWLAEEARAQEGRHRTLEAELGPTAAFWTSRARGTARLLEALAEEATERDQPGRAARALSGPTTLEETHA